MANIVCVVGRLTKDPETRQTTTGKQVTSFSIAVDDPYNKDHTNFFNVQTWGKQAEYASKYLCKGRLVSVEGRLNHRKYTTSDGANRDAVEIVAERVQGLDRPKDDDKTNEGTVEMPEGDPDPFEETW